MKVIAPLSVLFLSVLSIATPSAMAQEDAAPKADSTTTASPTEDANKPKQKTPDVDNFDVHTHTDWGNYYDPKNIFCGHFDCYRILGFDFESFGSKIPDTKVITKRYRALSRAWHPDKSKHKNAKDRFVKIARAYEVLTNKEKRKEYDFMRYNQEAYFQKYGADVLWAYAPKSDATFILIVLFAAVNFFTWMAQKHRWQMVADRLVKAAVEDWTPSQGGSPESKELRERAMAELQQQQQKDQQSDKQSSNGTSKSTKNQKKSKGGSKLTGKERKEQQNALLRPIIAGYVNDIEDFGAGFHKPTWKDLFAVRMVNLPITLAQGAIWQASYVVRRMQKKDLNDEEKDVLTERAVGHVAWDLASDDDRKAMVARKLWVKENLLEWIEEQEIKKLPKSDQKYINKLKKRGVKAD